MGRSIDQDVHAAFVEFRTGDARCLSVQCIYCQQVRAKNTSRQKQHLLECPGLQNHPTAQRPQTSSSDDLPTPNDYGQPSGINRPVGPPSNTPLQNGMSTPVPALPSRPPNPLPTATATTTTTNGTSATSVSGTTPKPPNKIQKTTPGGNIPAPPLDDVHAAFVEFRAKEDDKCLSTQCIYCNQIRAKNTSRQRQHLLECSVYLNVMKDSIPANNLLHRFDEGDIARSLTIPAPSLDLDFRLSVKVNPRINCGGGPFGQRNWISFIGGQWAGRWAKGIVIPGGQDSQIVVKDLVTRVKAKFLIQTNDEPPAMITVQTEGWWTGNKEVMEKMQDPLLMDSVPSSQYKFRVNIELETGDERYAFLNTAMWLGSGCRRSNEIVYDAYRIA